MLNDGIITHELLAETPGLFFKPGNPDTAIKIHSRVKNKNLFARGRGAMKALQWAKRYG